MSSETNGPVSPPGNLGRCAYCGLTGRGELFEPFNTAGNLACRAVAASELRRQGADPVYELGVLLRAVLAELPALSSGQLAGLMVDLGGCHAEVTRLWSAAGGSEAALEAERADRASRKAARP